MQKADFPNPISVLADCILSIWVNSGQARHDSFDAKRYSRDLAAQIMHEMNRKGFLLRVSQYYARTVSFTSETPRPQKGVFKERPEIMARRAREKERQRLKAPSAPISPKR